jgi:hypothetical protein
MPCLEQSPAGWRGFVVFGRVQPFGGSGYLMVGASRHTYIPDRNPPMRPTLRVLAAFSLLVPLAARAQDEDRAQNWLENCR